MKQKIKVLLYSFLMIFSIFGLVSCANVKNEEIDPNVESQLTQAGQGILSELEAKYISGNIASDIEQAEQMGEHELVAVYQNFLDSKESIGDIQNIEDTQISGNQKEGYTIHMKVTGTKRKGDISIGLNGNSISLSVTPEYSVSEKMANAGINTLMGMGVVFIVLIFIAFLISLFKYINVFEESIKKKKEEEKPSDLQPLDLNPGMIKEEYVEEDDTELIAVITAAILTYEGENKDGLVVRSIKRVSGRRR